MNDGSDATAPLLVSTRAGYERWAPSYDGDENPLVTLEGQHFPRLLGEVRGLRVADVGCGTGRHAVAMAEAGAQVTAFDFSPAMLARARARAGERAGASLRWVEHDLALPLPLADATCDRVTCALVLDHLADLERFFGELRRVCRPGGQVVASVIHPAMLLRGTQARFREAQSGREIRLASVPHQLCDYVLAASRAGLGFDAMEEHAVDEALVRRSPRAEKYLGWPLLLLMRLAR